jgi:hypothetical protein
MIHLKCSGLLKCKNLNLKITGHQGRNLKNFFLFFGDPKLERNIYLEPEKD